MIYGDNAISIGCISTYKLEKRHNYTKIVVYKAYDNDYIHIPIDPRPGRVLTHWCK